ncbi:MAG: 1-acyl-sn-glycerol-3-phosphate acyltransferase, partial [Campylobacterota bacterium]|nr:1-acyl-sn-glycerol-3-phosphate acyltransferase [Campylobacterota bacterium]
APQRRIRYIMDRSIYNLRGINYILKLGGAIPISNSAAKDAIKVAKKSLSEDNMIVIFPEGEISYDGDYGKFSKGYELIAKGLDGVIICANIDGLKGSFFSRSKKHFIPKSSLFRREVTITFSKPMSMNTKVEEVESSIKNLNSYK